GDFVDGKPATETSIGFPMSIALAPDGSLYIGTQDLIRKVGPDGFIHDFAGGGADVMDGPAKKTRLGLNDFALAPDGKIYVASGNYIRRIDIDTDHTIS